MSTVCVSYGLSEKPDGRLMPLFCLVSIYILSRSYRTRPSLPVGNVSILGEIILGKKKEKKRKEETTNITKNVHSFVDDGLHSDNEELYQTEEVNVRIIVFPENITFQFNVREILRESIPNRLTILPHLHFKRYL